VIVEKTAKKFRGFAETDRANPDLYKKLSCNESLRAREDSQPSKPEVTPARSIFCRTSVASSAWIPPLVRALPPVSLL
jgi:hypothetical protein